MADAGLVVGADRAVAAGAAVSPVGLSRPRVPDRDAMDAILLVLRTGMQWNALNVTGVCSSSSAHRRFQEWERAGVFHEIWRQGLLEYDEVVGIDWSWLAADGAMTKAPLGGPKTGPNPTDRAKRGRSVRSSREGAGVPVGLDARRREPQRPQAAEGHARLDPDRASRADPRAARRASASTRPMTTPKSAISRSSTASRRTSAPAARRSTDKARTPGWRARRWVVEAVPLVAEPQPRDPDPLVKEGREPPRPPPTRQRPDRVQEGAPRHVAAQPG